MQKGNLEELTEVLNDSAKELESVAKGLKTLKEKVKAVEAQMIRNKTIDEAIELFDDDSVGNSDVAEWIRETLEGLKGDK